MEFLPIPPSELQRGALVVLVAMAAFVAAIATLKWYRSLRIRSSSFKLLLPLNKALCHQRLDEAIQLCLTASESHLAKVILPGLRELKTGQSLQMPESVVSARVREAMEREVAMQSWNWRSHLGLVDAVGRTAPFVGLVIGTAAAIAAGTVLSLLTIWLAVYLRRRSEAVDFELSSATSEIRQFLGSHGTCTKCGSEVRSLHNADLGFAVEGYACENCCPECHPPLAPLAEPARTAG